MANFRSKALMLAVVVAACTLGAAPAAKPAESVADVEEAFASRVPSLDEQYMKEIAKAQAERLEGLKAVLDQAMEKKDLDAAVELREKIKSAEAELAVAKPPPRRSGEPDDITKLERTLRGTIWEWGSNDSIRFQPDGKVGNAGWSSRGLVTTWRVDRSPNRAALHPARSK